MSDPIIFPGLHQPSDGKHFDRACISIKRLIERRKPVADRHPAQFEPRRVLARWSYYGSEETIALSGFMPCVPPLVWPGALAGIAAVVVFVLIASIS